MSNDCYVNPRFKHLPELPDRVKALVLKERVHLGSLGLAQRLEALSLVWCCLPRDSCDERDINIALKALLNGALAWLETDHAELRRWLVDTGLLERDGYGRVYDRVSLTELPANSQAMVVSLCVHDPNAIAEACIEARKAHTASRAADLKRSSSTPITSAIRCRSLRGGTSSGNRVMSAGDTAG
jgi:predicted metal-binding transcription factor (methanogenesis marker protein 9)